MRSAPSLTSSRLPLTPQVLAYQANEGLAPVAAALEALRTAAAPSLSVADTIHLAGMVAVEALGGPAVAFRPGRRDSKARAGMLGAPVPQGPSWWARSQLAA